MTIGGTKRPFEQEVVPEGRRLRMKDWLKNRIGDPRYPGLVWLDEKKQVFRIPWKHAALHGWDQNSDGALFRDWALHTGACVRNAHPKQLKATFRCALHSLPDVHEDRSQAKKRGDDACRVYRFDSQSSTHKPQRRHIRIRNHREKVRRQNRQSRTETGASPPVDFSGTGNVNWNSTFSQESSFATNFNNNNGSLAFSTPQKYFPQQKHWGTRSESDISPGSLSLSFNPNGQNPSYLEVQPMQHSISVPEISPTSFPDVSGRSPVTPLHPDVHTLKPDIDDNAPMYFHTPLSPDNCGYSSGQSTAAISSPIHSPGVNSSSMECGMMSGHFPHDQETSEALLSTVIANYQSGNDFITSYNQNETSFDEGKLLEPLNMLGSFATMHQNSTDCARNTVYPVAINAAAGQTIMQKEFCDSHTSLRGRIDEVTLPHQSYTMGQVQTVGITAIQQQPFHPDYIEAQTSHMGFCPSGSKDTESRPQEWLSSPIHETLLPAASTLLSPSSSPISKSWIQECDNVPSSTNNYELIQQCNTFQGITCNLDDYSPAQPTPSPVLAITTTRNSPMPMYSGFLN